ncbi:methionine--tRNA ligase [Candidatus Anaplasma sp. TIGMIC]|uniref:methionine--tRNA ligase n=1 Tax=Candidatus Anaplasma sp. TIGMIC TaxID=3020713 RepID=UPI0023305ECC|nr:methionine--tRNA ligase [Candidatus Anaplasma sp. TIGMIC]MDB1135520.1 methionine--tRNA ligase [Candidatus Anaplasma sp. TIGMIC]
MPSKYFYISTPAYYVNDSPHIGHFYTTLVADVMARFKGLDGFNVKFVTGTDEHGQKVEETARKHGMPVLQFADKVSATFRELVQKSGFCCNDFMRTTEERHRSAVVELWTRLCSRGQIYRGHYSGFYSVRDETFYQEKDLVNGKAPTGAEVAWLEEPGYFFKLSEWQEELLKLYRDNPRFVVPHGKLNEVVSFVESGLRDLSVSRSKRHMSWGIDVPDDGEHLIYVWVDALSYYLALTGFPDVNTEEYVNYWQNCGCTHVVGKDILRFHAVYWPAMLMAAGLPLPKQIVAHGWWLNEGQKISKSLGNVIDPCKVMDEYGLENLRYFLLSETPIGNDASFSNKGIIERINCDLANNFGNLVMRTISLVHKECGGEVPAVNPKLMQGTESLPDYEGIYRRYKGHMDSYQLYDALKFVLSISSIANEYIAKRAPWKLFKEDRALAEAVMLKLLEYIRCIGIMLAPVMPVAADKILVQLSVPQEKRNFECFSESLPGGKLPSPMPIFPKYDL